MTGDVVDFSRKDYNGQPLTDLTDIIEYVKPTALFGLSTIKVIIPIACISTT
jgi:malate dehydrogenase (oxaloacetate-decarboxylating)(NADP+)